MHHQHITLLAIKKWGKHFKWHPPTSGFREIEERLIHELTRSNETDHSKQRALHVIIIRFTCITLLISDY